MLDSNIFMEDNYCGILSRRIKAALFESDRVWLERNGIEYSEFIRNTVHARVAMLRTLPTVTPSTTSTNNKLFQ